MSQAQSLAIHQVSNLEGFKKHLPEDFVPLDTAAQVGGTNIRLVTSGLEKSQSKTYIYQIHNAQSHNGTKLKPDLVVLQQILQTISDRAQKYLNDNASEIKSNIIFEPAAFDAKDKKYDESKNRPNDASLELPESDEFLYFTNAQPGNDDNLPVEFFNLTQYQKQIIKNSNIGWSTINDVLANALAVAEISNSKGEQVKNVVHVILGTGGNIGICSDFDPSTSKFAKAINTEHGQLTSKQYTYGKQTLYHQELVEWRKGKVAEGERVDTFQDEFAGGSKPYQSLTGEIRFIKDLLEQGNRVGVLSTLLTDYEDKLKKYDLIETLPKFPNRKEMLDNPIMSKDFELTAQNIEEASLQGNNLAKALLGYQFIRLAEALIKIHGEDITRANKLSISGSYGVYNLQNCSFVKEAFNAVMSKHLNSSSGFWDLGSWFNKSNWNQNKLLLFKPKASMDGLVEYTEARTKDKIKLLSAKPENVSA